MEGGNVHELSCKPRVPNTQATIWYRVVAQQKTRPRKQGVSVRNSIYQVAGTHNVNISLLKSFRPHLQLVKSFVQLSQLQALNSFLQHVFVLKHSHPGHFPHNQMDLPSAIGNAQHFRKFSLHHICFDIALNSPATTFLFYMMYSVTSNLD